MANVLNRTTKQYLISVNTPEYPTGQWIINPDLTAVQGFDSKYWQITGDEVNLMPQAQRDAVDVAELNARNDAIANQLTDNPYYSGLVQALIDEINILRAVHNLPSKTLAEIKATLRNNL